MDQYSPKATCCGAPIVWVQCGCLMMLPPGSITLAIGP
jgi:hypothetical protein